MLFIEMGKIRGSICLVKNFVLGVLVWCVYEIFINFAFGVLRKYYGYNVVLVFGNNDIN